MQRNVILLAICQALAMSGSSMLVAISGLVGKQIAPSPELATIPFAVQFLGTMAATIPASLFMGRVGRKVGFTVGQCIGMAGGALSSYAVFHASFGLLIVGAALIGVHNAFWQYYRFAAADGVSPNMKARAISYVLAGGVIAAVLGPQLSKWTIDLAPAAFAACYMTVVLLSFVSIGLLQLTRLPNQAASTIASAGRPIMEIMATPTFIVAALSSSVGYAVMNLLMTSTPLAMQVCGFAFAESATVIQWHVLGMFVPSFFTGSLIRRFGVTTIIAVGAALLSLAIGIGLSGIDFENFLFGLIVLGLGWNFMFIGGTTLLTDAYTDEERAKTQAAHDFIMFSMVAASAFASGVLHETLGWVAVNLIGAVPIAAAFIAIFWYRLQGFDEERTEGGK